MLVLRRITPPTIKFAGAHLYTWVERGTESKASCPRTQHSVPGQGSNPDRSIWRRAHEATAPPTDSHQISEIQANVTSKGSEQERIKRHKVKNHEETTKQTETEIIS